MNYFSSNGLVKLILFPIFVFSISFIYYCAFYTLYPIATNYSKVLGTLVICKFLSCFGAYGFLINELPLGSLILIVNGNFYPLEYCLNFYTNWRICANLSGYFYFLYSWLSSKSYSTAISNPSNVVISALLNLGISN